MVKICYICKKGEIIHDKKMSGMFCTGCGECFELGAFTDEVQYRENERGQYMAVGTTYNVEKGFVNSKFSNHAQFLTSVDNAKSILKRYCDKLYISESFAQISSGFYHQLLIKKFMNGRRLNVVLAACLYISIRSEGANVILLDVSDVSEANVYDIGRYYFQIIRILHFNIQTVDPCEYTIRFVDMLNLGDRSLPQVRRSAICIRDTANRLVQRMKRDWIHFGRRPSGVCAAAVLVAARINNVRCSIKDIISIAKVCESTIRKRINEFIETPSSQLTYKEFMLQDIELEEDPPSYKFNLLKNTIDDNLVKVEKYQEIIEERLKDSRAKVKGMYTRFLKEVLSKQENIDEIKKPDEENEIIEETIIDQNILTLNAKLVPKMAIEAKFLGDDGNPSAEEIEYWAEFRPSAKTLGLLKKETIEEKNDYEDLLDKNLNDIEDEEIDNYIVNDQNEVSQRQLEWNIVNKDFLEKEEKESLKRMQAEDSKSEKSANSKSTSRSKKKRRKLESETIEGLSASEVVEAACKAKSIPLNGINLKELFNESDNSSQSEHLSKLTETKETPISVDESTSTCDNEETSLSKNKEDAYFVSVYHSYAMKSKPKEPIIADSSHDAQVSTNLTQETEEVHSVLVDSGKAISIDEQSDQKDLNDEIEDDDYYFNEADGLEDDDELNRIKQKYQTTADDDEYEDGIEDCGF